jgi:hypothetical protein
VRANGDARRDLEELDGILPRQVVATERITRSPHSSE